MEKARWRMHASLCAEGIEVWGGYQVLGYTLAELGLGLHCSSSSCMCEHHPYHRQLCNASRAQLSTFDPWIFERRRDLLAPWRSGLRAWCDLVLPGNPMEEGFFPVQEQSLQRRCAITYYQLKFPVEIHQKSKQGQILVLLHQCLLIAAGMGFGMQPIQAINLQC